MSSSSPEPSERASEVTRLLQDMGAGRGDPERLLALVYEQLHALAGGYLAREQAGHTLQPTALVNEAWLRLVDQERVDWQGRGHFLALAAQAMRRILVDHVRAKRRLKRGGGWSRVELDEARVADGGREEELLALDGLLEALARGAPRPARVVELRFFGGLPFEQVAEALGVSLSTVEREWRFARAWLERELHERET